MADRVHPELIWAYTLNEEKIGPIHLAFDIEIERILQGEERLIFSMLPNDPKLMWADIDCYVQYAGQAWRITERNDSRTTSEQYVDFIALPIWYDLADDVRFGSFIISVKTIRDGLAQILAGTNWEVGDAPSTGGNYSYENKNASVLELLRGWSLITDHEIQFITETRQVIFRPKVGVERGIGFRYGRNLDEVTRQYKAPQVTRLYPVGANDLGITSVNGDLPYVENFDWYLEQGMTLPEARSLFMKEAIWTDDRYLLALNLMDAAVTKLEELAYPTISYACKVMDLSVLTGLEEDRFGIGDTVRVQDDVLDVDIRTRIVRMIKRPYEPWNNEVELSYLKQGLTGDLLSNMTSGYSGGTDWKLFVAENPIQMTVSASNIALATISVTASGNASGIAGGAVVGTATGTGTATFNLFLDGIKIGDSWDVPFVASQKVNIGIPTWFAQLTDGVHELSVRGQITSGSGTLSVNAFAGRLYVMMTGALGGGLGGGNVIEYLTDGPWVPYYSVFGPDSQITEFQDPNLRDDPFTETADFSTAVFSPTDGVTVTIT